MDFSELSSRKQSLAVGKIIPSMQNTQTALTQVRLVERKLAQIASERAKGVMVDLKAEERAQKSLIKLKTTYNDQASKTAKLLKSFSRAERETFIKGRKLEQALGERDTSMDGMRGGLLGRMQAGWKNYTDPYRDERGNLGFKGYMAVMMKMAKDFGSWMVKSAMWLVIMATALAGIWRLYNNVVLGRKTQGQVWGEGHGVGQDSVVDKIVKAGGILVAILAIGEFAKILAGGGWDKLMLALLPLVAIGLTLSAIRIGIDAMKEVQEYYQTLDKASGAAEGTARAMTSKGLVPSPWGGWEKVGTEHSAEELKAVSYLKKVKSETDLVNATGQAVTIAGYTAASVPLGIAAGAAVGVLFPPAAPVTVPLVAGSVIIGGGILGYANAKMDQTTGQYSGPVNPITDRDDFIGGYRRYNSRAQIWYDQATEGMTDAERHAFKDSKKGLFGGYTGSDATGGAKMGKMLDCLEAIRDKFDMAIANKAGGNTNVTEVVGAGSKGK